MPRKQSFEWDDAKDRANRIKHGVSFAEAQAAFFDPHRVIAEDLEHSGLASHGISASARQGAA